MVAIAKGKGRGAGTTSTSFTIREMEKVTTFTGIGGPSEDGNDEAETGVGEQWATDKPGDGEDSSPKKRQAWSRASRKTAKNENSLESRFSIQQEQKLVLSDDDIEDDW
jgi:cell cycle checkpoint protein